MRHIESRIQQACVKWFRLQYAGLATLLFAVPNGGARSKAEASIMKAEGVTAGVADLLLLFPNGDYHGLCIEMKTGEKSSKQSPLQIEWMQKVRDVGYKYIVCHSFDDFAQAITEYLRH